jgi:phage gpG-like protein
MQAEFGDSELAQLTDRTNGAVTDDTVLGAALTRADSEINVVPLPALQPALRRRAGAPARRRLRHRPLLPLRFAGAEDRPGPLQQRGRVAEGRSHRAAPTWAWTRPRTSSRGRRSHLRVSKPPTRCSPMTSSACNDRAALSGLRRCDAGARGAARQGRGSLAAHGSLGRGARLARAAGLHSGRSPYGVQWAALKLRQGQPLRDKGSLMNSITWNPHSNSVDVGPGFGPSSKGAAVQQFGATIKPVHGRRCASRWAAGGSRSAR